MLMNVQRIDISSQTIFRAILILLGFAFVYLIRDILVILFAAFVLAAAIEPLANYLQKRRIPRAVTVLGAYAVLVAAVVGVVTVLIPPLTEQLVQLAQTLPRLLDNIKLYHILAPALPDNLAVKSLQDLLFGVSGGVSAVVRQTSTFFSGAISVVLVFVMAFYLVIEKDALKKVFRLVVPHQYLPYVNQTIDRVQIGIGRWVIAQLLLAGIFGIIVGIGLWLIGVRYALLLGLVAGVAEIVPIIGPLLAAVPGVLIGLSQSSLYGMAALVFYVVAQQAENHFLVPSIMRRAVGLNPLITIIAVLLGARLAGLPGVILSVPIAMILVIFWSDLFATATDDSRV